MFEAKIIAHSVSEFGKEIITYQLKYPRFIHAEFLTHRTLSRNASSSRAIPVAKMIEQVRTNPAMPIHWGANQPGMQAEHKCSNSIVDVYPYLDRVYTPTQAWKLAAEHAANVASGFEKAGYHKQVVNRILEPFQWISVVCTATEWDNFHALRSHADAQPEIKYLSDLMLEARAKSTPEKLDKGDWHLPYADRNKDFDIAAEFYKKNNNDDGYPSLEAIYDILKQVSAARCARVSYLTHEGKETTIEADLALCERLAGAQPFHASPFEHQASPDGYWEETDVSGWDNPELHGNLVGWIQNRKTMVGENITTFNY